MSTYIYIYIYIYVYIYIHIYPYICMVSRRLGLARDARIWRRRFAPLHTRTQNQSGEVVDMHMCLYLYNAFRVNPNLATAVSTLNM